MRALHDRPFHRRRHETAIAAARRDLAQLPGRLQEAHGKVEAAARHVEQLAARRTPAIDLLGRGARLETTLAGIDEHLSCDLRVRTRIARLERPASAVQVLGERPDPGPAARAWDVAAGQRAQHQVAFGITEGLGAQPMLLERSAYAESSAHVNASVAEPATIPALSRTTLVVTLGR